MLLRLRFWLASKLVGRCVDNIAEFGGLCVHRLRLPERIKCVPSPGADNWGYEGCQFWVNVRVGDYEFQQQVAPGDWIVETPDGNWRACDRAVLVTGFNPLVAEI